jgi:signal transduction histidine kinase
MDEILRTDIVELCLDIDRTSHIVYRLFANNAENSELKEFWMQMSRAERYHQIYWEKLLVLIKEKKLENVFHNPVMVLKDLRELRDRAWKILDKSKEPLDNATAFQYAFQLEFYMTYPAFGILYKRMAPHTEIESPGTYYEKHIDQFLEMAGKYGGGTIDSKWIFELLNRLWESGKDMAKAEESLKNDFEELKLFAYSVAHDVKSPSIGIIGFANLLERHYKDVLDEKGRLYCSQILKSSEQLVSLIEKINLFIATKELPLAIEEVHIKEILGIIKDEFAERLVSQKVSWSEPEILPTIYVDRLSIIRLFRNLVDNALKYGGKNLSKIGIGYEEQEDFHVFSIKDNGVGIGADKVEGLYQRGETSKGVPGTGLGLAIVQKITERHKGKMWIEAGKDGETVFHVALSKNLLLSPNVIQ